MRVLPRDPTIPTRPRVREKAKREAGKGHVGPGSAESRPYVGWRCQASPIRDVAQELRLDWYTVKAFEQQYMREPLDDSSG
jgi:hypothetical protein